MDTALELEHRETSGPLPTSTFELLDHEANGGEYEGCCARADGNKQLRYRIGL